MPTLPNSSKIVLRETLLDLLWQQWTALGLAGGVEPRVDRCIDPEALLLITTTEGRHDSRLFNETLDWLWQHGESINVQRLKNIQKALGLGNSLIIGAIAKWLSQRSAMSKWKPLADIPTPDRPKEIESLYFLKSGSPQPAFGPTDPIFLQYGFRRGPIKRRGLSVSPDPLPASSLLWKLRALFGVQARAEIVLWLLTHKTGHAAEIARAVYYFPRTIEGTLRELAGSGLIKSAASGREKSYWLNHEDWLFLKTWDRPTDFPEWMDWPRFFSIQERFNRIYHDQNLDSVTAALKARSAFDELKPMLVAGHFQADFIQSHHQTGEAFSEALVEDLLHMFARI